MDVATKPDPREARPVTLPLLPRPDSTVYGPNRTVRGHAVLTDKVREYATAAVLADRALQDARIAALEAALREAIEVIEAWHGPGEWEIYRDHSPEMKRLRAALAGEAT